MLVDGNDYRTLDCKTQDYFNNQSDAEGMYAISWSDNGMDFAATSGSASGSLKALFSVRDGNNAESMTGVVESADTKNITMKWPSVTDVNKLALPEKGLITINNKNTNMMDGMRRWEKKELPAFNSI